MKVATKLALGSGLLLLPLILVSIYHIDRVEQLADVNRNISTVQFTAGVRTLTIIRQVDLLDEYVQKYVVTNDPGYREKMVESRDSLHSALDQLGNLELSKRERGATNRLLDRWTKISRNELLTTPLPQRTTEERDNENQQRNRAKLRALSQQMKQMRSDALAVIDSTEDEIEAQVLRSDDASRRFTRLSWTAIAVALFLSVCVLGITVYSINKPLQRLIEGTRVVSRGDFVFRFEETSRDEFAQLTRAFNRMLKRLEELEKVKRELLSHVSHELKTPLVAMEETNRLLLDEIPGPLTPKQKRFLRLNVESSTRLSSMIMKLLDISRLEVGVSLQTKRQPIEEIVEEAVTEFEGQAHESGITLVFDTQDNRVHVQCERERLIQVFENLIENAIKFAPDGTSIGVKIHSNTNLPDSLLIKSGIHLSDIPEGGGYAIIEVSDEGPGIPDELKEKIFEKFFQVRSPEQDRKKGIGLGLAICREIIACHHGAIWVEDRTEGGSSFFVILPSTSPPANTEGVQ